MLEGDENQFEELQESAGSLEEIQQDVEQLIKAINGKKWDVMRKYLSQTNARELARYVYAATIADHNCIKVSLNEMPVDLQKIGLPFLSSSLTHADYNGCSLFHYLVLEKNGEDALDILLNSAPQSATIVDNQGALPLHYAVRSKLSSRYIESLLNKYADSVDVMDNNGNIPLQVYVNVWEYSLKQMQKDYDGFEKIPVDHEDYTDLQLAKLSLIYLLYTTKFRDVIPDDLIEEKWFPLHEAIENPLLTGVFLELLTATMPEEVYRKDKNGNLPHHLVLSKKRLEDEVVMNILNKNKAGVLEKNNDGRLPMIIAIENGRNWQFIKQILLLGPQAISTRDEKTGLYPFLFAACYSDDCVDSLERIYQLLRWDPHSICFALP